MKFGQAIEYNDKHNAVNRAGKIVPDISLFLKKPLYEVTTSGL